MQLNRLDNAPMELDQLEQGNVCLTPFVLTRWEANSDANCLRKRFSSQVLIWCFPSMETCVKSFNEIFLKKKKN